jgi:hypothetical protein
MNPALKTKFHYPQALFDIGLTVLPVNKERLRFFACRA